MSEKDTNRRDYLSIVKVVACFLVLWDHVNGSWFTFRMGKTWILSTIIHVLVNCAVPLFAMTTGALLLDYRDKYSTKEFFNRRLHTVVLPFLFWSIIYMIKAMRNGKFVFSISGAVNGILNYSFISIFWYFISLFGAYLSMPIFSAISKDKRQGVYKYCILGYLVINLTIPFLFKILDLKYNTDIQIVSLNGFLLFVIAGYYIDHYEITRKIRLLIYFAGTACAAYNIIDCLLRSFQNNEITRTFSGYASLTYMITGLALFTFFRYMGPKVHRFLFAITKPFFSLTFGIFLIQILVLDGIKKLQFIDIHSWIYISFAVIPVFAICAFCCYIIKNN